MLSSLLQRILGLLETPLPWHATIHLVVSSVCLSVLRGFCGQSRPAVYHLMLALTSPGQIMKLEMKDIDGGAVTGSPGRSRTVKRPFFAMDAFGKQTFCHLMTLNLCDIAAQRGLFEFPEKYISCKTILFVAEIKFLLLKLTVICSHCVASSDTEAGCVAHLSVFVSRALMQCLNTWELVGSLPIMDPKVLLLRIRPDRARSLYRNHFKTEIRILIRIRIWIANREMVY